MFGKDVYLTVFYCFCFVKKISTVMLEGNCREERGPILEVEVDIIIKDYR